MHGEPFQLVGEKDARLATRIKLNERFHSGREIWLYHCALETEHTVTMASFRQLFHLIRTTGRKPLNMSEMVCEADGSLVCNQQRRFVCRADHFKARYSWSRKLFV